ncbi:MAG: type 2 lantipeptide synthetase LanM family protein [Oscillatoria princeps RMCB-10]|jgi:lantibiotic modifying enzyme|nr:type 2 lantipeptide synthetase LanM family protein [Oscillatoria princeps RMCB-10]
MTVTNAELAEIVARASSLYERLGKSAGEVDEQQVQERLAQWCQVIAKGNWDKFQKRLAWDGLDVAEIAPALGSLPVADCENLPGWAETLREVIQTTYKQFSTSQLSISPAHKNALPFREVLLPAIIVARGKLLARLGSPSLSPDCLPLELLSQRAYLELELGLLQKLVELCAKTLEVEFAGFRPLGDRLLNLLKGQTESTPSKTDGNQFLQHLLGDGLLAFFQKYPVLGRLVATTIDLWVEATAELLLRLKADMPALQQVYLSVYHSGSENGLGSLGKVAAIQPYLSDAHNQNRCVMALAFESGLKLVYKPKGLGVEVAYTKLLEWCNRHGAPLPFKVLKVCDRQTHGWVEYAPHLPCEDEAASQRFYQRAGMLLCLSHALRVVDCHKDNLIACGEHLVLADMETVAHHEAKPMAEFTEITEAETAVNRQFWDSVLRTGLLPRWEFSKDGKLAYDISALGSSEASSNSPIAANLPVLNGVALCAGDYLDELVAGFERMYRFLLEQRDALLAEDSPLTAFRQQRVRFIFRPTKVYGIILEKSNAPEFLQDGADRSIALDFFSRAFLSADKKPAAWPILRAELRAVEQLDIPYFGAFADSDALTGGLDKPIEAYFEAPSYSQVQERLRSLSETDLAQQTEIIKGTFYARIVRDSNRQVGGTPPTTNFSQINPLTGEELLREATRIAREIQERAIRGADGSVKWIGFGYVPSADRFQLMPLDDSLYDGNGGIALFLAALDCIGGTGELRDLALGAFQSVRKALRSSDSEVAQRLSWQGIGGAAGLGSIIYSMVKTSQFLQEPALLEDALRVANFLAPARIAADKVLDITSGTAGAMLGLLVLYSQTGEPAVLEKAAICGEHLCDNLVGAEGKTRAWKILGEKQYTGFSHGAAGIAYALLRLYAVTQNRAYLKAACEGIAYERSVFYPAAANWPDLRYIEREGVPRFMVSWCHGAAGIALARLGGLSVWQTEEICEDVEVALQTTCRHSLQGVDCVCCGNFGRLEALLAGAQKLCRPQLREIALQKAAWGVARAQKMGGYQFPNLPVSAFSPSFFQGTAGIGYQLLRLAHPDMLPSVLLWE